MTVQIPLEVWQEIIYLTKDCVPNEIGGIGEIEIINPRTILVTKVYLPKQVVTPASIDWRKVGYADLIYKILKSGGDTAKLKFRWHSHGSGDVYMSHIDKSDISKWEGDWVISLVVNSESDYHIQYDQLRPVEIRNVPLKLQILYPELNIDRRKELSLEKRNKVKEKRACGIFPTKQKYSTPLDFLSESTLSEQEE